MKSNKYPKPVKVNYNSNWQFSFTMAKDKFDYNEWLSEMDYLRPSTCYKVTVESFNDNEITCVVGYEKPTLISKLKEWLWRNKNEM